MRSDIRSTASACALTALWLVSSTPSLADTLPRPPPPFQGKIDALAPEKSLPDWPKGVKAAAGAPNIVVILLDDVGFSAPSTFGGVAETRTLQALADEGVTYNQFHVTALCSPTRAAALTGRNHHQVGFGQVATFGFPGYNSVWNRDTASIAEVLRQNGYGTAAFGKWHNTPDWEITPAGPFDRWPTSLGFERFYGFFGGAQSQWEPRIYRNTTPVEPARTPEQGYQLVADMADEAIDWLRTQDAVYPDKPVFIWFAPGGQHWPQHVPAEWIAKYRGKFDQGWDKLRAETFARQKKSGVIPKDALLTPRPAELPAWSSLSGDQQRLLARQAEVAAAFLAYTDDNIGRVLREFDSLGRRDNTLVLYIAGDNGGELRGDLEGRDLREANGTNAPLQKRLESIDELGGPRIDNLYSGGWGWADNTPFQYGKGMPSYLGGVRNGLVVSWPRRLKDKHGIRRQFSHITDIVPTLLDVTGIRFPDAVDGVAQVPLEGMSLVPSLLSADAVPAHRVQYFEIGGTRAIYQDGWWAGARNVSKPANASPNGPDLLWSREPFGLRPWELYNLDLDYSQSRNLARRYPDKLRELVGLFDREALRNDLQPLSPPQSRRPSAADGRKIFTYHEGVARIPSNNGPDVTRQSHRIEADIDLHAGSEGVIVADGSRQGGFALYIREGRLVYAANSNGQRTGYIASAQTLPAGRHRVAFEFVAASPTAAAGVSPATPPPQPPGKGKLFVDGQPVGEGDISRITYGPYESLDIGEDLGSPVSSDYTVPYRFNGEILEVKILLQ